MIGSQIRELFSVIARGEPEISLVDAELARRRGRARLRWRWAAAAGTPLLAAATVVAVVVTVGLAPAHPRLGTAVTGNGPAAPRQFSPLVPYLSFGWLPAGQSLVMGGVRRTVVSIEGGSKPYSAHGWDLNVYAAGQCHFTPAAKTLKCGAALPEVPGTNIVGPAPAVRGHGAWWAGSSRTWWASAGLVWQYARNGWAWLFLPNMYRYSPQQMEAVKRDAVKIAGHVRYGTPTLPLVFPAQLTHLPHNWRGEQRGLPAGRQGIAGQILRAGSKQPQSGRRRWPGLPERPSLLHHRPCLAEESLLPPRAVNRDHQWLPRGRHPLDRWHHS